MTQRVRQERENKRKVMTGGAVAVESVMAADENGVARVFLPANDEAGRARNGSAR